jgi:hypothetical protein
MQVQRLPLSALPSEPAGLPTTYTSRSIRLKRIIETRQAIIFGSADHEKSMRSAPLSHRDLLAVNADKRKYASWLLRWDGTLGLGAFAV